MTSTSDVSFSRVITLSILVLVLRVDDNVELLSVLLLLLNCMFLIFYIMYCFRLLRFPPYIFQDKDKDDNDDDDDNDANDGFLSIHFEL